MKEKIRNTIKNIEANNNKSKYPTKTSNERNRKKMIIIAAMYEKKRFSGSTTLGFLFLGIELRIHLSV